MPPVSQARHSAGGVFPKRASAPLPGGVIFLRFFNIILRHLRYTQVPFPLPWPLGEEGRWREGRGGGFPLPWPVLERVQHLLSRRAPAKLLFEKGHLTYTRAYFKRLSDMRLTAV